MKDQEYYLAFDFGASSGRLVEAANVDNKLSLHELARIEHRAVRNSNGVLEWEIDKITQWLHESLLIASKASYKYWSIGIDTWGVDYILLNEKDRRLGGAISYRDERTRGTYELIEQKIPLQELYQRTGSQFMEPNSICQLIAAQRDKNKELDQAKYLLLMPSYLSYVLCGAKANEPSMASTTQLFSIRSQNWELDLLQRLQLPQDIFVKLKPPGSTLATNLKPDLAKGALASCRMLQVASHDTASAVLATPFTSSTGRLFISSGTWSVMGLELNAAILTEEARTYNFANELGYGGRIHFLKSITGLWILQELRRDLFTELSYSELEDLGEKAEPYRTLLPVMHPKLAKPGNMGTKIRDLCSETKEAIPAGAGALVRCVYDSLSLEYRLCYEHIKSLAKEQITAVHVIGGGSQSNLLNQLCANSLQLPVYAGPVEAAAIGNILAQVLADDVSLSLADARDLVRNSFPLRKFTPKDNLAPNLSKIIKHYKNICAKGSYNE